MKTGTAERQQAWAPLPCRDSAQHTIARWGRHAMGRHCPPVLAAFQRCRRQPEVAAVPGAGGRSQLCQNRAVSTSPSQEMHIVQPRCCVKGSGPALQTHPRAFFCVPVLSCYSRYLKQDTLLVSASSLSLRPVVHFVSSLRLAPIICSWNSQLSRHCYSF